MNKSQLKALIKEELKKLFITEQDPNTEPELSIGDKIEPEAEPTPEPDRPESTLPKEQPLQNISKQEATQKIRETKGKMFTVTNKKLVGNDVELTLSNGTGKEDTFYLDKNDDFEELG